MTTNTTNNNLNTLRSIVAELTANDNNLAYIIDPHYTNHSSYGRIYNAIHNGKEVVVAVDIHGGVYHVSEFTTDTEDLTVKIDNNISVGSIYKGKFYSWDADRGDLVVDGLESSGYYLPKKEPVFHSVR